MSRIDPVSLFAVAFLFVLIALTSWARAEQPGATLVLMGGGGMEAIACSQAAGDRPGIRQGC